MTTYLASIWAGRDPLRDVVSLIKGWFRYLNLLFTRRRLRGALLEEDMISVITRTLSPSQKTLSTCGML